MILTHILNLNSSLSQQLLAEWQHVADQAITSEKSRLARALLRYSARNSELFLDARDWIYAQASSGQPHLAHPAYPKVGISFSHSGEWVACALNTSGPVGIDVEIHRSGRNLQGIAELSFGPAEQQRSLAGVEEFYRIWCVREAVAKATGAGLPQVADRLDYAGLGPFTGQWRVTVANRSWNITHAQPAVGVSLACASPSVSTTEPPEKPTMIVSLAE